MSRILREKQILDFIVRDYVKTANPVSSERIAQKLKPKISSATIRNAMMNLEEEGFLEKEYPSSGRMPTDMAYRYFVDYCMSETVPENFFLKDDVFGKCLAYKSNEEKTDLITDRLAEILDLFIAIGPLTSKRFSSGGVTRLLKQQEFKEHDLVQDFGFVLDHLEDVIRTCLEENAGGAETEDEKIIISIGKENRFKPTKVFSILTGDFKNKEGKEYILFSLGPRRMDYEKNYSLIYYTIKNILPKIV